MEKENNNRPVLYALLIGINEYPSPLKMGSQTIVFPPLRGCVNDTTAINDYLQTERNFTLQIKQLHNSDATRQNIVAGIQQHLAQATANDVALLYYSGHGTQEETDTAVFQNADTHKLQSLVCYADAASGNNFLLANKELRWLIHNLAATGAHIVTLFDCCHSGGTTRNAALVKDAFKDAEAAERKVDVVFPQRPWGDFIFSHQLQQAQFTPHNLAQLLPEGFHFQLTACEQNESAMELNRRGVFTQVLLSVLKHAGSTITYANLWGRIRQYMRNVYEQRPTLYVGAGNSSDWHTNFLNKPASAAGTALGEATFNETDGWQLNMGAIQGVAANSTVQLFTAGNRDVTIAATTANIKIDYCSLQPASPLDEAQVYHAEVQAAQSSQLPVYVDDPVNQQAAALPIQQCVFDSLFNPFNSSITLATGETAARYVLRQTAGLYYITLPNDRYRPLVQPLNAKDTATPQRLAAFFKQMARWEFIKTLRNPVVDENTAFVKIEIAIGETAPYETIGNSEQVPVTLLQQNNTWQNTVRIRLTNTTQQDLYCCALYLLSNFASFSKYLNPPVKLLTPGNPVELVYNNSAVLAFAIDEIAVCYNWETTSDYLKLVISTVNFDATTLDFGPLPMPATTRLHRGAQNLYSNDAAGVTDLKESNWHTQLVELCTINPLYNTVGKKQLESLLGNPETAPFAKGLYCTNNTQQRITLLPV
ncbi:caspase family protein [Deminuibacter soli]|uniref:Caspase family protein n=1 Tax=Deminuibacter soli TaxID=2291815 RepID=A0A3E1NGH2_9BACT|nr:caspase family protein [Deminuibacter soli]RFM26924.1 caspase family protein [Deminuibacter soli]